MVPEPFSIHVVPEGVVENQRIDKVCTSLLNEVLKCYLFWQYILDCKAWPDLVSKAQAKHSDS